MLSFRQNSCPAFFCIHNYHDYFAGLIGGVCVLKLEMVLFVPIYITDKLKRMPLCDWIN